MKNQTLSGYSGATTGTELYPNHRVGYRASAKRGRAGGEETGANGWGRCLKSVARIQKRSSRRSVTPAA